MTAAINRLPGSYCNEIDPAAAHVLRHMDVSDAPDDTLDGMFPGTGGVTAAWRSQQLGFALPDDGPLFKGAA